MHVDFILRSIKYIHIFNNCSELRYHIDGLVQERRNSIANALELRLYCTNPSKYKEINGRGWQYLS